MVEALAGLASPHTPPACRDDVVTAKLRLAAGLAGLELAVAPILLRQDRAGGGRGVNAGSSGCGGTGAARHARECALLMGWASASSFNKKKAMDDSRASQNSRSSGQGAVSVRGRRGQGEHGVGVEGRSRSRRKDSESESESESMELHVSGGVSMELGIRKVVRSYFRPSCEQ